VRGLDPKEEIKEILQAGEEWDKQEISDLKRL